jgi:formate-dependent phosphoribosylglycinamide formyltransferase (GAR transformylase)
MNVDSSDDCENAYDSIRVRRELDSNVIDESYLQRAKHVNSRISTLLGVRGIFGIN